ncbi:MFS transporter [Methylophilus aquaticus]|uniref:MFS transporter n=1 Tax=Methylophilus aquaticus TaxID=1971610 RepID=A0ABT9JR58_9PROT|nr:MFS transporter [Methylophilus aquaticus]MDP8567062.1 MFS transporter [Methylophilus aquaticus]
MGTKVAGKRHIFPHFSRIEWLLVMAIILVAIDLRPGIVSMGPAMPSMIAAFSLSHTVASLLTAIPDLLMGALALPTPWLVRRFGVHRVLLSALLLLCLSTGLRAFATDSLQLMLATIGVGGGIAVAGAMFAGIVKACFARQAALMMGIYATALSLGSALSAGLTGWLLQVAGWRLAVGVWALFGLSAMVIWYVVIRQPFSVLHPTHLLPAGSINAGHVGLPLRNAKAWLLAIYFACINFLFYSLLTWTADMYQEAGISVTAAGAVLAGFTVFFMLASLLVGMLSKKLDRRGWLFGCAMLSTIGLVGMVATPGAWPWVWVPLSACGLGGAFALAMTLPLDYTHSPDEANRWNAFVLTVGYLIAASGPFLMGVIRDESGNFVQAYQMLAGVSLLMVMIAPFLKPQKTD